MPDSQPVGAGPEGPAPTHAGTGPDTPTKPVANTTGSTDTPTTDNNGHSSVAAAVRAGGSPVDSTASSRLPLKMKRTGKPGMLLPGVAAPSARRPNVSTPVTSAGSPTSTPAPVGTPSAKPQAPPGARVSPPRHSASMASVTKQPAPLRRSDAPVPTAVSRPVSAVSVPEHLVLRSNSPPPPTVKDLETTSILQIVDRRVVVTES